MDEFERELEYALRENFSLGVALGMKFYDHNEDSIRDKFDDTHIADLIATHRADLLRELRHMRDNTSGGGSWRMYLEQRISELEGKHE